MQAHAQAPGSAVDGSREIAGAGGRGCPIPVTAPSSDGPTTDREFLEQLAALVRRAHRNGLEVTGGWDVRDNGRGVPEWGVEIFEVERRAGPPE